SISMFFTGSLLTEVMVSLNGLGLLGYEATVSRNYPVMFGPLYIFTLVGLLLNSVSDIRYTQVVPRIGSDSRGCRVYAASIRPAGPVFATTVVATGRYGFLPSCLC